MKAKRKVIRCPKSGDLIFEDNCELFETKTDDPHFKICLACVEKLLTPVCGVVVPAQGHYAKYPPAKGEVGHRETGPYTLYKDLNFHLKLIMHGNEESYKQTQNPVYGLEALLGAHDAGFYPPLWVLDWLVAAFRNFHDSQGREDLTRLLGFKAGPGQSPAYKQRKLEYRNAELLDEVTLLRGVFGITQERACRMVAAKVRTIKYRTLLDLYVRNAQSQEPKLHHAIRASRHWSKDAKKGWLDQYPPKTHKGFNV